MKQEAVLSLRNISKTYAGVKALDDVSLDIREGEVHALVGANGAGKSTLIKTISGAINPDSGAIVFDGAEYAAMSPQLSSSLGIEVIYQEFNLIPTLTVAENLFLGNRVNDKLLVDFKAMRRKAAETLKVFELDIDVRDLVKHLSVAHMQIVEIAKALGHNLKLLVLDEPTAPLTTKEVEVLYRLVRSLREKGISIIYISHRLEEVFELSDRITVLRDGRKIVTLDTAATNRKELIRHMIDSDLGDEYPRRRGHRGDKGHRVPEHLVIRPRGRDSGPDRPGRLQTHGASQGDIRRGQVQFRAHQFSRRQTLFPDALRGYRQGGGTHPRGSELAGGHAQSFHQVEHDRFGDEEDLPHDGHQ